MQLVLLCVLVLSLLQPGLLQDEGTEATPTNGGGEDLSRSIRELKNIVLVHSKLMVDFSHEVRGQLATINATVNSLQGQLESLTGEVTKNRERINSVNKRVKTIESGQAVSQNTSLQLANTTDQLSNKLNQLRLELTANQQMIGERVDGVRSQQLKIQNESMAQLQIVHTAFDTELANATDQLSTGLNQLRRELTANQQSSELACNRTQVKNTSMETPQDTLDAPVYQNSCGGSPGWRRVAFLNMTDPSQDCPSGWRLTTHSVRTCGRASSERRTCDPVTFPVSGGEYSRVCGRARGYQYGSARAFYSALHRNILLDGSYVDGISITHNVSRQHIWTFAVGLAQEDNGYFNMQLYCYCDVQTHPNGYEAIPPSFVGNDYFCESAVSRQPPRSLIREFHSENPLWDGQNCGQNSTCCSMNNPPYFMKDLPAPTTDDIEVRLCSSYQSYSADYLIELLEIYVQ